MKTITLSLLAIILLTACAAKKSAPVLDSPTASATTLSATSKADQKICKALASYILGKKKAVILTDSARYDLEESTWPEVQCSVEEVLDSPFAFNDLVVKKTGEGRYKYECVCPDHGDRYIDCCTIHATLGSDGKVRILHITWD